LRIGIGHAERRAAEVLDEIDRRTFHQLEAHRIDNQLHAVGLRDQVVGFLCAQLELVGEAGAAPAVDGEPENCRLFLTLGDPRDALRRILGQDDLCWFTRDR